MADLMNFSINRNGATTGNIPVFDITCDIVNGGEVVKEIRTNFPAIFNEFSPEVQDELLQELATILILKIAAQY